MEIFDPAQFLGVKTAKSSQELCRFLIAQIPYEKTTSYGKGAGRGPAAVIKASCQVELWDEELAQETYKLGVHTLKPVNCSGSPAAVFNRIEKLAAETLKLRALPVFIGGEHSITQALARPFIKKYRDLSVFHFDAHADLRDSYEGSAQNHACALYPVSRKCPVIQAGIRSIACEEAANVNSGLVKTFPAHQYRDINKLIPKVLAALTGTVYMTIDVDGFDPSVMPGTGTPQPGGYGWYEALELFKAVITSKKVVGIDVVEVAPQKGSSISEFAAAKLIYRLMGYCAAAKRPA